jgi:hypothetical protein
MAVSIAAELTKQFYEWEKRGRGHTAVEFSAQLEPLFVPFFEHYIDAPYIDDGKRHTFLSELRRGFVPDHTVSYSPPTSREDIAFPDNVEYPGLTIYLVTIPKGYACGAASMDQCLTMLAMCGEVTAFEIIARSAEVTVQFTCRDESSAFVFTQLRAYFPDCAIRETYNDDVLYCAQNAESVYTVDFGLREEFMRPMAAFGNHQHDPYVSMFGTIEQLREGEAIILQVLFCGTQNAWSESILASVTDEKGGSFFIDAPEMPGLANEKVSRPLLAATVRLAAFSELPEDVLTLLQHSALALVNASTSNCNALVPLSDPEYTVQRRLYDLVLRKTHRVGMLLNTRELATLAHLPPAILSKNLLKGTRTTKQAPLSLRNQQYILGTNEHQGQHVDVGINTNQRLRHTHILGATGQGKSTLMHTLICQDIDNGEGCCVLDPHGDLIDAVLRSIPHCRVDDVVLIDPYDSAFPIGLNVLSAHSDLERELLASDLVALFRRFSTSWGDQMNSVFANAIMAFVYNTAPGHLGDLRKFLIEGAFRAKHLLTCTDPDIAYYWQKEFPLLKSSSLGSILTRLDAFLRPKVIRNMVCQERSLDFAELMDTKKIVLVKLSQGLLGAENSYLLGALIVAKMQQTAMARQALATQHRVPFFCYIDEFHHFITPSMSSILSGGRKYGLGLVLAHQDIQQVAKYDTEMVSSLLSNAETRICFRLGDADAKRLQDGFSGFSAEDLQNLSTGEAVARVGASGNDFSLEVHPPTNPQGESAVDVIRERSRSKYGVPIPQSQPQDQPDPKAPYKAQRPADEPTLRDEAPPQQEVREHRYLQTFIKKLGEDYGYKAQLEVRTPDGNGQVDVLLEKGSITIAIEVSVTTTAEWELHNIGKCLAAGYSQVVVCSKDGAKLSEIERLVRERISVEDRRKIQLISPENIQSLFAATEPVANTGTVMRGYRVKIKYSGEASDLKKDIISRIVHTMKGD